MAINTTELNQIVNHFVSDTPHVQGAVLVTHDGLPLASTLPAGLEESRAAAMAAAAMTIGDRIGDELQRGNLEHILFSGTQGYSILTLCGSEALFLVLASAEVKQGILLLEIRRIITTMAQLLS